MDPVLEKVGVKIFVEAILKLYVRLLPHHLENNIRSKTKCGLQSRTNLISELQFLSGEVQLGPSLAGEIFIFLFIFSFSSLFFLPGEVDVDDLVAVPADLKLLVGPDVEVLPLLVDLADDAPDGQVVQVHLVPVVVLHRVQEGLQHPRVQVGLEKGR